MIFPNGCVGLYVLLGWFLSTPWETLPCKVHGLLKQQACIDHFFFTTFAILKVSTNPWLITEEYWGPLCNFPSSMLTTPVAVFFVVSPLNDKKKQPEAIRIGFLFFSTLIWLLSLEQISLLKTSNYCIPYCHLSLSFFQDCWIVLGWNPGRPAPEAIAMHQFH